MKRSRRPWGKPKRIMLKGKGSIEQQQVAAGTKVWTEGWWAKRESETLWMWFGSKRAAKRWVRRGRD